MDNERSFICIWARIVTLYLLPQSESYRFTNIIFLVYRDVVSAMVIFYFFPTGKGNRVPKIIK